MRALKISVALLVVLLFVGDRVGAVVAAKVVATRLQAVGSLPEKPDVTIRGWPFLTQAISGRYDRIELVAHDVKRHSIDLTTFEVTVRGARIPLSAALGGHVPDVPAEGVTARALIAYSDIAERSQLRGASAVVAGQQVLVTGRFSVGGKVVVAQVLYGAELTGSNLVLDPMTLDVKPKSPDAVRAVAPLLALRIGLGTLPYGLRLTGIDIQAQGIMLSAKTGATVLQRP